MAAEAAIKKRHMVRDVLHPKGSPPFSSDASVVVFGSLARDEFTAGSDLDWTLLVDGQADSQHLRVAQEIEGLLIDNAMKRPGPTGTFGDVAFTHSLIHDIGGTDDTNVNTTRRMLLLLEACAIGNSDALDRVQAAVIQRYLEDDLAYVLATPDRPVKLPRFLLNDLVRFWRTMAVDYASKHRLRRGKKWAIRNVKLRFSRKLIFAAGLIACFDAVREIDGHRGALFGPSPVLQPLATKLMEYARTTPLEVVAAALLKSGEGDPVRLFAAYNEFIGVLAEESKRGHLEDLKEEAAATDPVFQSLRTCGGEFDNALTEFFFDSKRYGPLIRQYGVF